MRKHQGAHEWEQEGIEKLKRTNQAAEDIALIPSIKRLAGKYHDEARKQKELAERESERCNKKRYEAKGEGQWAICKDMGSSNANPLIAVTRTKRGPQGQPKGSVATSPKEIDAIIRETYGKIYKGNVADHEQLVREYMKMYDTKGSKYVYHGKAATMTDLTAEDLRTTARTTKETAAGLDRWTPAEMRMLSLKAYGYLADILNDIEKGASWPEQLTSARAAFLSKDPNDELNPLAYRVLLMLPALYRMWSKTRLRHLAPWIAEGAMPEFMQVSKGEEPKTLHTTRHC